jgi:hypothetical protein
MLNLVRRVRPRIATPVHHGYELRTVNEALTQNKVCSTGDVSRASDPSPEHQSLASAWPINMHVNGD